MAAAGLQADQVLVTVAVQVVLVGVIEVVAVVPAALDNAVALAITNVAAHVLQVAAGVVQALVGLIAVTLAAVVVPAALADAIRVATAVR